MEGRHHVNPFDIAEAIIDGNVTQDERHPSRINISTSSCKVTLEREIKQSQDELNELSSKAFENYCEILSTHYQTKEKEFDDNVNQLNIDYLFQGVKEKLNVVQQLCEQLNITLEEVAYIGDDLNDIKVLKAVGISATPSTAPHYIQQYASLILTKGGGDGCFREFVEKILNVDKQFIEEL